MLNKNSLKLVGIAGSAFFLSKLRSEWGQQFLYESLQKIPGIPVKFSQILEQKWDLKSNFIKPKIPVELISEILANEIPHFWNEVVSISSEAWVASIGQVHRVLLNDGREVVVKIQFPELAKEIIFQIDQLIWMLEKSPAKNYGFISEKWRLEITEMFFAELDYQGELSRQQQFLECVGDDRGVLIPKVYPEWSTKTILVQEYLSGLSLENLLMESSHVKQEVAEALFRFLSKSLISFPLLHGDLQPRNWAWHKEFKKIILYDFGSCVLWSSSQQRIFESLVDSIQQVRDRQPLDYLVALGFDRDQLSLINSQLPLYIERILEPFWNQRFFRLSEWNLQKSTNDILGNKNWIFRMSGPPWLLWMMRSFSSIFYALRELSDNTSFANIYAEEKNKLNPLRWKNFSVESQADFLKSKSLSSSSFANQAQRLHIRIKEGNKEVVAMQFPINVLDRIETFIDTELIAKIKSQKLDLEEIKKKAYSSGLIKQELFSIIKDKRDICVWIE